MKLSVFITSLFWTTSVFALPAQLNPRADVEQRDANAAFVDLAQINGPDYLASDLSKRELIKRPEYAGGRRELQKRPEYTGGKRELEKRPEYMGGKRELEKRPSYTGGKRELEE